MNYYPSSPSANRSNCSNSKDNVKKSLNILFLFYLTVLQGCTYYKVSYEPRVVFPTAIAGTVIKEDAAISYYEDPNYIVITGRGNSMEPLFKDGTKLLVRLFNDCTVDLNTLNGEVIIYKTEGHRYVVHHAIMTTRDNIIAKGLNNNHNDLTIVTHSNLYGVVVATYP